MAGLCGAVVTYHPRLVVKRLSEGADYSYGLYIFAYPVQQTLIWATGMKSVPLHIAASLAITLMIAGQWLLRFRKVRAVPNRETLRRADIAPA